MWFKTLKVFRLNPQWQTSSQELEDKLSQHRFVPGASGKDSNLGWVEPLENHGLVYSVSKFHFFTLRAEKKLLPATVINQFAKEKALEIEEQQGYKPGRKQMKEIKEMVTDTLLPKAFSIFRETRVCMDVQNHWLYIEAGTAAKADEVIGLLVKALDPMPVQSLITAQSPGSFMTSSLVSDEDLVGFTVDPSCELKSTQQDRATIRFANIRPDEDEIKRHVESGKVCSKLGLTWQDRVSFVLNDVLELKKITPLEQIEDDSDSFANSPEEQFEAEMTLMCSTFNLLLEDLTEALGGFKETS